MNPKLRALISIALRLIVGAAAGVALGLSYPTLGWWWMALVGVCLLTLLGATSRTSTVALVFAVAGFCYLWVVVNWLSVIGSDVVFGLGLLQAAFFVLIGLGTKILLRVPFAAVWIAALWVAVEAVTSRFPFGGFGWIRLAYGQSESPLASYASLGGIAFVSFLVALTGAALATMLLRIVRQFLAEGQPVYLLWSVAGFATTLVILFGGLLIPLANEGESQNGPNHAVVAAVEGGVPGSGMGAFGSRAEVVQSHIRETKRLAGEVEAGSLPQPEAVIWPENASDLDPLATPWVMDGINEAAQAIDAPILVGAVIQSEEHPGSLANVGIVWDPKSGPGEIYVKRHLVPFGEYIPMRQILANTTERFALIPRDFEAGSEPGVLQVGPVRLGDIICFEILDDKVVNDAVADGGRMLALQANNATYITAGEDGNREPMQLLAIAKLRAIESGRSVVVATTNGVTGAFGPDGSVLPGSTSSNSKSLVADVPLRDSFTLATSLGRVLEFLLVGVALVGLALAFQRSRKRQIPDTTAPSDDREQ